MKNKNIITVIFAISISFSFAQVRIVNGVTNGIAPNSSAFIDASSNPTINQSSNVGKGLLYPRTDLSNFNSFGGVPVGIPTSYPNHFDGMVVYNTATSGVAGVGSTQGTLSAGFWFYDNKTTNTTGGTWKPLGGGGTSAAIDITAAETVLATKINGAQLFGIKGTFTTTGTSTSITIPAPAGITAMYSITIFKAGTNVVYDNSLFSYDITTGAAITGSPLVAVLYPAATYDYVLEYLK